MPAANATMRKLREIGKRTLGCLSLLAIGMGLPVSAQTAVLDRNAIVLDPAHGGADAGGRIGSQAGNQLQEKDVTLAFAAKLRAVFAARGFNVAMTRNGDQDAGSSDQRAELANRAHAVACLVLHASTGTSGVVLGTSALGTALMRISPGMDEKSSVVPWNRAQEMYVAQSDRLANEAGSALARSSIPVTLMRVELRPLDSLICPAMSVELGVLRAVDGTAVDVNDDGYQQRVAESLADALARWRKLAQPPELTSMVGAFADRPVSAQPQSVRLSGVEGPASVPSPAGAEFGTVAGARP